MKAFRAVLVLTGLSFLSVPVHAAPPIRTVKFKSGGSVVGWNWYVGTYAATLDGGPKVDIWCVDFAHHVSVNNVWNAYDTQLTGNVDLSYTRNGPGLHSSANSGYTAALGKYEKAAWLTTQYLATNHSDWKYIQAAIWEIMSPTTFTAQTFSYPFSANDRSHIGTWLAQSNTHHLSDYSGFHVLSDVTSEVACTKRGQVVPNCWTDNPNSKQEFLYYEPTVTPEPSTYLMVGTGLFGLVAMRASRKRKKQ